MGNALRCLESCAAERLNWEHNNTETWQSGGGTWFQSFLFQLLSHVGFERWSRSWCAPPWLWVSIWTRWTQISATMTGRFRPRSAAAPLPTTSPSAPPLVISSRYLPAEAEGWGDGSLLPACLLLFVACNKSLLIFQLRSKTQGRGDKRGAYWNQDRKLKSCYQNIHAEYSNKLDWALAANCP